MRDFDDSYLRTFGEKNCLRSGGLLYRVPANSGRGYNFEYLLFVPNGMRSRTCLILEGMNYGTCDTLNPAEKIEYMYEGFKSFRNPIHFCNQDSLFPILYPLIPRYFDENLKEEIYLNMLSSNSFIATDERYKRVDLQIINMIQDACARLKKDGVQVDERIIIHGFSAAAKFANRFALLHPEIVRLVIAGGLAGVLILPLKELDGKKLLYSVGIGNIDEITEEKVKKFRWLKQFYYQGMQDEIDAFENIGGEADLIPRYKGIISAEEMNQLYKVLGRDIKSRWHESQKFYKKLCKNVTLKTYENGGHNLDAAIAGIKEMLDAEAAGNVILQ